MMSILGIPILSQAEPVSIVALGVLTLGLAVGAAMLWNDGPARAPSPALRVPGPNDVAPAWIGLAVMMLFYVYVPVLFRTLFVSAAPPATGPSTRPIDLALAIRAGAATYVLAILAAIVTHALLKSPARRLLGLARPTATQVRFLVGAGLVAIPLTYLVSIISQFILRQLGMEHPVSHPMLEWMTMLRDRPGLRALAIVSATVFAPVFEELFFRGHLQTGLIGAFRSRGMAIVIASVVFASLHPWWTIPPIFVLSLCLGVVYERTNNLWIPIGLHVAFNSVSTAVFLVFAS